MHPGRTGFAGVLGVLLALLAAPGCGGGGGGSGDDEGGGSVVDLVVQQTLPTNGQEISGDLSDVEGLLSLKFSERLLPRSVLDPNNAHTGLTSDVSILDSSFVPVPGMPRIGGERKNLLTFRPWGGVLPNGQYTITATRDVRNFAGFRLNNGKFDHRSSFTVGPDTYAPVVRSTFPAANQGDVPTHSQIVVVFNESLSPASVSSATFTVVDGGNGSATPLPGVLTLSRDAFEVVFTPDPANPLPAFSTIVVTLSGGPSGITDAIGNPFEGDPATPGVYEFQFRTVYEPPDPVVPPPVDMVYLSDGTVYYATGSAVGAIGATSFEASRGNGVYDLARWGDNNPIPNSERKIGSPGAMLVDTRLSPSDNHTALYVIDRQQKDVVVMSTRNMKVLCRWRDFADPRDLDIDPSGTLLFVTDHDAGTVVAIPVGNFVPWSSAADAKMQDAGKRWNRQDIPVGRGPVGCALFPDRKILLVANSMDDTVSEVDTGQGKETHVLQVDREPWDVATTEGFWFGWFGWVTCRRGGADGKGSVAMYRWRPGTRDGAVPAKLGKMQGSVAGLDAPEDVAYDWGLTAPPDNTYRYCDVRSAFVANSGSDTITKITIRWLSIGISTTILPQHDGEVTVGQNPTKIVFDPVTPFLPRGASPILICAVRGGGYLAFLDARYFGRPQYHLSIPGVRYVTSYWDQ